MPISSTRIMTDMKLNRGVLRSLIFAFSIIGNGIGNVGASHHLAGEADPTIPGQAFEIHAHGRFLYAVDNFTAMLEYSGQTENLLPGKPLDLFQSVTLGGYYRLHSNIKFGAFYRLQFNERHDDDWIEEGPSWFWADTRGRAEHLGIIDITPRVLLPFLPGENWVGSIKSRYEYNFTNTHQKLMVRPGITYFWLHNREPILNISLQYAAYFSLNFGAVPWYRHGPYLNAMYHVSPNILLDIGVRRQWVYWSESEQFHRDFPGQKYAENIYTPWIVDAGFIIRLP